MLSDGGQARRTSNEKKLVLVWVEKNGIPLYFVLTLLEIAELGDTDVVSLKKDLDSVFEGENVLLLDYQAKLTSATSDGAHVNLGIYNWALTMMKKNRPWLITIHCANHKLELPLKDAVKEILEFTECKKFYANIFLPV